MHRMSATDAAFLATETPDMHMHVVWVLLLDATEVPAGSAFARIERALDARMHLLAPLRRRAVEIPGAVDFPMWVEDPEFRLGNHLVQATLPEPGGPAELAAFVGAVASRPLDRGRPLWELWVVDGIADGSVAIVTKLHHAIMDGAAGGELMANLLDLTPEGVPVEAPAAAWKPDALPSGARLVVIGTLARIGRLLRLPRALAAVTWSSGAAARAWVGQRIGGASAPLMAPRAPFNGSLTPRRVVSFVRCSLEDLKTVKRAFNTTVNDVVLAATASSLRDYLLATDALPDRALIAAVPVDVRRGDAAGMDGNRVSNMMVPLPVGIDDPVARLHIVHESALAAKEMHRAAGPELLADSLELVAPVALIAGARAYSRLGLARLHPPIFNLIVSNVAGPPVPLYVGGMRVLATYPMGPLMEGSGLNLTILSDMGGVDVGVMACPDLMPDPDAITAGFVRGIDELLGAAGVTSQPRAGAE